MKKNRDMSTAECKVYDAIQPAKFEIFKTEQVSDQNTSLRCTKANSAGQRKILVVGLVTFF